MFDLIWSPYGLKEPEKEYRFHPKRRWRFDYAYPDSRIAVEIEGGIWVHGRHNRAAGFLGDLEKYNQAAKDGWRIFRFTPHQLKTGEAQSFMKGVLDVPHHQP